MSNVADKVVEHIELLFASKGVNSELRVLINSLLNKEGVNKDGR